MKEAIHPLNQQMVWLYDYSEVCLPVSATDLNDYFSIFDIIENFNDTLVTPNNSHTMATGDVFMFCFIMTQQMNLPSSLCTLQGCFIYRYSFMQVTQSHIYQECQKELPTGTVISTSWNVHCLKSTMLQTLEIIKQNKTNMERFESPFKDHGILIHFNFELYYINIGLNSVTHCASLGHMGALYRLLSTINQHGVTLHWTLDKV